MDAELEAFLEENDIETFEENNASEVEDEIVPTIVQNRRVNSTTSSEKLVKLILGKRPLVITDHVKAAKKAKTDIPLIKFEEDGDCQYDIDILTDFMCVKPEEDVVTIEWLFRKSFKTEKLTRLKNLEFLIFAINLFEIEEP